MALEDEPNQRTIHDITSSQADPPTPTNSKYYFPEEPMVTFQIENQLFRVHRHHLAQGSVLFREMFISSTMSKPIPLQEVTVREFEALLDFFYRPRLERSTQDYLDLMQASHQLKFQEVIDYSAKMIKDLKSQIQPLERLVLGDKYGIEDWSASAFDDLLAREETLTLEEVVALDFDRFVRFVAVRDERRRQEVVTLREEPRAGGSKGYQNRRAFAIPGTHIANNNAVPFS